MMNDRIISEGEALEILKNELRKVALKKHAAELRDATTEKRTEILSRSTKTFSRNCVIAEQAAFRQAPFFTDLWLLPGPTNRGSQNWVNATLFRGRHWPDLAAIIVWRGEYETRVVEYLRLADNVARCLGVCRVTGEQV